ncbi:MAG: pyridoxamine 5'-phosphate oxidase family protein [Methanospirillum sp.]|nr:pyridoxamine 5'-phosphate oxidase family protein [Methanospirillum sp.]
MRRRDKELTDPERIQSILDDSLFCHLAMCDAGGRPYCLPICFVSHEGRIILHSANEGRKIEVLHDNPRVCLVVERNCHLIRADTPCGYGMAYESVLIEGRCRPGRSGKILCTGDLIGKICRSKWLSIHG